MRRKLLLAFLTTVMLMVGQPASAGVNVSLNGFLGGGGWYRSNVSVFLSCTGTCDEIEVRFNNGPLAAIIHGSGSVSLGMQGITTVNYQEVDVFCFFGCSRTYGPPQSIVVKIDTFAPGGAVSLSPPDGSNGWYRSAATVSRSCTDLSPGSGCQSISWRVGAGPTTVVPGAQMSFQVTGDAAHSVVTSSTDVAGNNSPPVTTIVRIDGTAPATTVSMSPPDGANGWYLDPSHITHLPSCSDATSGCASTHSALNAAPPGSVDFIAAGEGMHSLNYKSFDVAGNDEAVKSTPVNIDLQPPSVSLDPVGLEAPLGLPRVAVGAQMLSAQASDSMSGVGSVTFYSDNLPVGTDTDRSDGWSVPWTPSMGTHNVHAVAQDIAGRTALSASSTVYATGLP
ncbi:MAG TPA: Ig-like domain-containing protein [Actinomycetota bacterium]|nr:Ig-like domain-containing protein [Actinomycetota bacterium]